MQKLKTVDSDTLLYQPLEKPCFLVDGLIPTDLSVGTIYARLDHLRKIL